MFESVTVRYFCIQVKGKAPANMCTETLVSPQLSVRAPIVVCVGFENICIEDLE